MISHEMAASAQRPEALTTETMEQRAEQEARLERLAREVDVLNRESRNNFAFGNLVTDAGQEFLDDTNAVDFLRAVQETANDPQRPTSLFHVLRKLYKDDPTAISEAISRAEVKIEEQRSFARAGVTLAGPMLSFENNPGRINAKRDSVQEYKRLAKIDWNKMEGIFGATATAALERFFSKLGSGDMALNNFEPGADWQRFAEHLTDNNNNVAEAYEALDEDTVAKAGPLLEQIGRLESELQTFLDGLPQELEAQKTVAVRTFLKERSLINDSDLNTEIGSIIVNAPAGQLEGLGALAQELDAEATKALAAVKGQLEQLRYLKRSGPLQYYKGEIK